MKKADLIFGKDNKTRALLKGSSFTEKLIFILCAFIIMATFLPQNAFAQGNNRNKATWATGSDPFNTNVFIENFGQFDSWTNGAGSIEYATNKSDKVFFRSHGCTFRVEKIVDKDKANVDADEKELLKGSASKQGEEEDERGNMIVEKYAVQMNWLGSNPSSTIEVSEETSNYYTFGEKGYESIKAKGYKKLIYKNLYSGIDVEYTIPEKGGIKYKLIVHPGADVSQVKMEYTGDVNDIIIDNSGNIVISTPAGNIVDHAPVSYYEDDNSAVISSFSKKGNVISFNLVQSYSQKTVIIDPWTVTPTSLATDNSAYDIIYDDYGNVFVSGGVVPYKLAKYTPGGTLLWTYTEPAGFGSTYGYYSRFCIIPQSGTSVIGEGWNASGPLVLKVDPSGTQVYQTGNLPGNMEIWVMFYNRCTQKLVGFGGGTANSMNMQVIADTNLTSSACSDFNGYGTSDNDIASVVQDINGDFYALMSSQVAYSNHILKSLASSGYTPPCAFDISNTATAYDFYECSGYGIPGLASPNCTSASTVRANALALNNNYLFSYDGKTINAWNKTTGAALGNIVVNAGYAGGQYRTHEGIAVDDCDNVYVGGTNQVHAYSFNGSSFTAAGSIPMGGEVYDVQIDRMLGMLYVSGLGFVTVTPASVNCNVNQLTVTATSTPGNCTGNANVTATGGVTPYTYEWSNGATTTSITNVPQGWYYVTVTDNSCIRLKGMDSVYVSASFPTTISPDTSVCSGTPVQLSATGGLTYIWSPSSTLSNASISNPIAMPTTTTMYYVTISNGTCTALDSVQVSISSAPNVSVTNTSICNGVSDTLFASGATTYLWNTGSTNSYIVVNPATTTTYTVTGTTAGCTASQAGTVTVNGNPNAQILSYNDATCGLNNGSATASGGGTYLWSGGQNTATISGLAAGTYTVTVTSGGGCTAMTSVTIVNITPPAVTATWTDENCGHANGAAMSNTTNGTQPYTYLWSNGQTTPNISNLPAFTYTVTVTDADGCTTTASVVVSNIAGPSLQIASTTNDICTYGNGSASVNAVGGLPPYTYFWSNGSTSSTATGLYAGVYTCTVTDANNCTAMNTATISDSPGPSLTYSTLNEICDQSNGSATVNPNGGTPPYTYLWSNGQTTQTATGLVQGSYTVTVNDQNCSAVTNMNVLETPGPDAGFSAHPKVLTIMDGPVTFTDNSSGNIANWSWNFGDGSTGSGEETDHPYPNIGIYLVTLIVTDNNGCMDTIVDTIKVKDIFTFYIPNAFTPNDDGYNDYFAPQGVNVDPDNYEMFIFDRWGNQMFDTRKWDAVLHISEAWNGTKDNKGTFKDVVMDVYVYRIKVKEIDGPKHEYIGRISLIP